MTAMQYILAKMKEKIYIQKIRGRIGYTQGQQDTILTFLQQL